MKKMTWMVLFLSILTVANFANAQVGKTSRAQLYGEFEPVVGGWSEYQITTKGEGTAKMKFAVVGKEGNSYWYEASVEGGKQGRNIFKMLVSGDPRDTKNVKRVIVKQRNDPATEMPVEMMPQSKGQEAKGKTTDKGMETIIVPAGTFATKHMQYQDASGVVDAWTYKEVSPYGLVKSVSKDVEMVLVGYGTGAKTLITETPEKFQMPEGQPKRK